MTAAGGHQDWMPGSTIAIDYRARLDRIVAAMLDADLDGLVLTRIGTLGYLTGVYLPWRSALVLDRSGEPRLITQDIDVARVRAETWLEDVVDWSGRPSFVDRVVEEVERRGLAGTPLGVEMSGAVALGLLLANELRQLEQRLPDVSWRDAVPAVDMVLVRKEPAEVDLLERASRIAEQGVLRALDELRPGLAETELAGVVEAELRARGSEWAWSLTGGTEIASGPRTGYDHCVCTPPTRRPIGRGELVTIDAHAMYALYQGEFCTNAVAGRATPAQRRLADAFERIVEAIFTGLRPGARIADVSARALEVAEREGVADRLVPLFGHGLGTDARIPPIVAPWNRAPLDEATTLVVLVQLTDPELGGLRTEYPVVVEADGARPLVESSWTVAERA